MYSREYAVATKRKSNGETQAKENGKQHQMTVSINFIYDFCGLCSKTYSTLPSCEVQPGSFSIDNSDGNKLMSLLKRIRIFSNLVALILIC